MAISRSSQRNGAGRRCDRCRGSGRGRNAEARLSERSGAELKAENPAFPDRVISKSALRTCRVAGMLVGTIRKFN